MIRGRVIVRATAAKRAWHAPLLHSTIFTVFLYFLTAPSAPKMVGRLIFLAIVDGAFSEKWSEMDRKWRENGFVRLFAEAPVPLMVFRTARILRASRS